MEQQRNTSMLETLKRDIAELIADESGLTTTEYALLLVLVALASIFAYRELGIATGDLTSGSTQSLPGHGNSGSVPPGDQPPGPSS